MNETFTGSEDITWPRYNLVKDVKGCIQTIGPFFATVIVALVIALLGFEALFEGRISFEYVDFSPDGRDILVQSSVHGLFTVPVDGIHDLIDLFGYSVDPLPLSRIGQTATPELTAYWASDPERLVVNVGVSALLSPLPTFPLVPLGLGRASDFSSRGDFVLVDGSGFRIHSASGRVSPFVPIRGVLDVAWSPTGDVIAVGTQSEGLLYDRGGNFLTVLPGSYPGSTQHFSWSPIGDRIAYVSRGAEPGSLETRIYSLASNRSEAVAAGMNPVWSPNGEKLLFQRGPLGELTVLHLLDGREERIAPHSVLLSAAWSFDGTWIAYEVDSERNVAQDDIGRSPSYPSLFVRSILGGESFRISSSTGKWGWSPTKSQLAYSEHNQHIEEGAGVYVLDLSHGAFKIAPVTQDNWWSRLALFLNQYVSIFARQAVDLARDPG